MGTKYLKGLHLGVLERHIVPASPRGRLKYFHKLARGA